MFRFSKSPDLESVKEKLRNNRAGFSSQARIHDALSISFHHLLLSLEGAEKTACLKIVSAKTKSSAAILLYKGRALGCVYGRYSANEALKFALSDLATPGTTVEEQELPEEIVLASAAMFLGQTLNLAQGSAKNMYEDALNIILQSGLPGCIVLNKPKEQVLAITYLAEGKITGIHITGKGWAPNSDAALKLVHQNEQISISASVLALKQGQDPATYGISLTSLANTRRLPEQRHSIDMSIEQTQVNNCSLSLSANNIPAIRHSQLSNRPSAARYEDTSTFAIRPR